MLFHTENFTTVTKGQCVATVIADSIQNESRITTLELVYPRYIHSELMTHRAFSRNASSSRATPLDVLINECLNDPVFFDYVGTNQSGMVAGEELSGYELRDFKHDWYKLAKTVANTVKYMSERYNVHKQTLNRALEPFSRIRTLVTATDFDNFFELRLAPDAQPEMQSLAKAMMQAMKYSKPAERMFHAPYTDDVGKRDDNELCKISVARCARVSYARLDGKPDDIAADIKLFKRLLNSGHMSPFEHVAYYRGDGYYANFKDWQSLRNIDLFDAL